MDEPTPFGRYVRLYTLHQIEQPSDLFLLRIRIETLHYSFAPLARLPVDAAYAEDPRAGSDLVRQAVLPRLQILLDTHDPWRELRLGAGQETLWQRYAAERGLPASPVRVPVIHAPAVARRRPLIRSAGSRTPSSSATVTS